MAVAARYGRNYTGLDISENYVQNTKKRLTELKSQLRAGGNLFYNSAEIYELTRLFIDIGISAEKMVGNNKLLTIFAEQFELRMNNGKKYTPEKIAAVIKDFGYWAKEA